MAPAAPAALEGCAVFAAQHEENRASSGGCDGEAGCWNHAVDFALRGRLAGEGHVGRACRQHDEQHICRNRRDVRNAPGSRKLPSAFEESPYLQARRQTVPSPFCGHACHPVRFPHCRPPFFRLLSRPVPFRKSVAGKPCSMPAEILHPAPLISRAGRVRAPVGRTREKP